MYLPDCPCVNRCTCLTVPVFVDVGAPTPIPDIMRLFRAFEMEMSAIEPVSPQRDESAIETAVCCRVPPPPPSREDGRYGEGTQTQPTYSTPATGVAQNRPSRNSPGSAEASAAWTGRKLRSEMRQR